MMFVDILYRLLVPKFVFSAEGDGDGGGGGGDFLSNLPADIRGDGALRNFSGADGGARLAKSYVELNRTFSGRTMLDMPAPSDDTGRRAVLAKLGHAPPERADGYNLPDKPAAAGFREMAHRHGLPAKQAEALFTEMHAAETRGAEDRKTRNETRARESEQALRRDWGDQYDPNLELVKRGFEHFLPEDDRKIFEATGIILAPAVSKMFHGLGLALKEGTMHTGSGGPGGPSDKAGFRAQRVEIEQKMVAMRKEGGAGFDPLNSGYRQLLQQRQEALNKEAQSHIAESDRAAAGGRP